MRYELKLVNGTTVLEEIDPKNIGEIKVSYYKKWTKTKSFPFFSKQEFPCVTFREYRAYPSIKSPSSEYSSEQDLILTVDCSLKAFCRLFGIEYIEFNKNKLYETILSGD